ncbi:hypothetical protein [Lentibacillus amyloliquefaciens]|uniref:Uncharacterized protein n=1 Tax=Lentibacillus amyloliquefaciens TaxID=1472767 RepID=A0A0U4FIR6_9BACI|nr:hypothetical protein [Lentibacillus amyloliquefaciens]ALX48526.1 hypothetical protein AOX59_07840 [Lentibacillus amyloliquefaciens]
MKKGLLIILTGAMLVFTAGIVITEGSSDIEASDKDSEDSQFNHDKIDKIMDNAISHHENIFRDMPTEIKIFLKKNPKMLKEFVQGPDPAYMNSMNDAMGLVENFDKKDAKYLYENEVNSLYKKVQNDNSEEPPAKDIVPRKELISKLENN